MLKVIRELLLKMVDNIDAGNSNLTEDEALQAISYLKELTNKEIWIRQIRFHMQSIDELLTLIENESV